MSQSIVNQSIVKKIDKKLKTTGSLYALVDCAATAAVTDADEIFNFISRPDILKYSLFSGENAWAMEQAAPYLVPLEGRPDIEQWLYENGRGRSWGVFFTSEADAKTLRTHLQRFFAVRAENGRDVFFRFYDPVILRDFLPTLTDRESTFFFGPVNCFVAEDEQGRPLVFKRPAGQAPVDLDASRLVLTKRALFSEDWNRRLMQAHQQKYEDMGVAVFADPAQNTLTIEEKDGSRAILQKTDAGVAVTTGEGRLLQYELSTCKTPTAIVDPAGHRIDFDLQERENIVTGHKQSLLNAVRMQNNYKTWVFDYDDNNHLERLDYPDGAWALFEHDAYGNLRTHTDRNSHTTLFERDAYERLTRMVDVNRRATLFDYQDRAAASRIRFADGNTFGFAYTDEGSLKTFIANDQKVADYTVDPDSGSWTVDYHDGTRAEFMVENGRVVRAINPAGTLELAYDEHGRLISETFNNRAVRYQRNPSGLLTGITGPSGQTITFGRDGEQRVNQITDWGGHTIEVAYAANGALESIAYPNGAKLSQNTGLSGLPDAMTLTGPADDEPVFKRGLDRDRLDRVIRMHDGQKIVTYTYDKEGRLFGAESDDSEYSESFEIDAKANRLADRNGRYQINAADRIVQDGFSYDTLGNLSEGAGPKGRAAYRWTAGNRLTGATLANAYVQYAYDAFGRRVEKHVDGQITRTVWAGAQPLCEIVSGPDGGKIIDYLFFPSTPVLLAMRDNDTIYYAAFGHRYETLCLTDTTGKVAWLADYDAFGNARIEKGADFFQPFRLAGHYLDEETGLHYCAARYYDPHLGRYLSPDPLFLEGGADNFYAYCDGDPINCIDPTGEFIFCAILIGAALGAAIGGGIEYYRQKQSSNEVDGFKIATAALIGGAIGAIGGGVGAAVEVGVAGAAAGTVLGKSALATMAAAGFLSGAASSVAEQCTETALTDKAVPPLEVAGQALTDGVVGAVIGLATFGVGSIYARRMRKVATTVARNVPEEQATRLQRTARRKTAQVSPEARVKSRKTIDHSDKSVTAEPVNAVTGEVVLTQTDFSLPGRLGLTWTRHYGSQVAYDGLAGLGWQTPADARLEREDGMVVFYDGTPGGSVFPALPEEDNPVMEAAHGAKLAADVDGYHVRLKSGLTYHFGREFAGDRSMVTRIGDANGNYLRFIRDRGRLAAIEGSDGRRIDITCEHGRIQQITYQNRTLARYQYQDSTLTAVMDAAGHSRRYAYQDGRLIRHSDRNHLSFYYGYDDRGRCIHSYGDDGLYDYRFEYVPYERCTRVTNSLGHVWHYYHDADQLPVKVVDGAGAAVVYAYDEVGQVVSLTDALEQVTRYAYDEAGNVIEITRPDDSRMVFVYDEQNQPVQILDPNDQIWQQRFNEHGQLVEKISPLGHKTIYAYNRNGDPASVTDPAGRTTGFEYDTSGLPVTVIHPSGDRTHYQRDLFGNITAVLDPSGAATRYSYDEKSRLCSAVSPTGLHQSFEWDPEDNLLLHTDAQGRTTRFEYTGVNELARRINADGTSVGYHYDTEEQLIGVTNEKGRTHLFTYDEAGRLATQTDYWGHSHRYAYDPAGQMIQSIDPLQRTVTYTYDPAGRLIAKCFESEERETFTWDPAGNLIAFESPDIRVERSFDPAGRMTAEKSGAFSVQYEYDSSGLRIGRSTSCGNRVAYSHDDNGRVSAIAINDQPPITLTRNLLGQITAEQLGGRMDRAYDYDEEGRLVHQSIASALNRIDRSFQYDPSGNRISRQDSGKGAWRFSYDPMGRLIEAIDPMEKVKAYAYDPAGDLLEHLPDPQAGLRNAVYQERTYRFDAAGNLVERQQDSTPTRFDWDEQNRLRTVRTPEDDTVRMAYDALGRRVRKSVNGERTFFAWDGDALLAERYEDQPAREYVYYPGTFEPLAAIDGDGSIYYYHNDPNGLPQELTRPNGEIVWSVAYDALGRVEKIIADEVAQPLRLQGQYFDEETGLCYNRHRYFDPHICSFISQDPLGLAAGENVYAYAPNVWGWVDPLGLACKKKPDPNILSGHGGLEVGKSSPITILPEGTSVTVWTKHGNGIYDHLGNSIELKRPITYADHGNDIVGAKTYLPGSVMPDYTLYPPYDPDLNIMGNPTTVTKPTRLSELLKPSMGNVSWAACLEVVKI